MIVKVATEEDVQEAVSKRLLRYTVDLANQKPDPIRQCQQQAFPRNLRRPCDDDLP